MSTSKSKKKKPNSGKPSNKSLKTLTVFHAVSIALVVATFIFAIFPAFSFKFTFTDDYDDYSKKEIEETEETVNETIGDILKINFLHPLSVLNDDEFKDALGIDEPSSDDYDILGTAHYVSLLIAVVQSLFFIGTLAALSFALFKPLNSGAARILPMILSICSIIYSILLFALLKGLIFFTQGMIDVGEIQVFLTFSGWAYLILSIALLVITIIANKNKKKLKTR